MCHGNHCFLNLCISQYARQSKWFMEQWDKFSAFFCHFEQQLHCRKKFIQCIGEKSCVIVWIPLLLETRLRDTSTNYCVVPEIYSFLGGSRNLGPILNIMEKRYLVRNWDCFQFLIWLLHCVVMVLQHFTFFTSLLNDDPYLCWQAGECHLPIFVTFEFVCFCKWRGWGADIVRSFLFPICLVLLLYRSLTEDTTSHYDTQSICSDCSLL